MTAQAIALEKPHYYTPEEYLEREETAEYKSEYHDGLIIPMTGGTTNHNQVCTNILIALSLALRKQGYRVFMGDVRLWIPQVRHYKYPDVMVVAGQPEYHNNRKDTITNPQVIVEVLSKSTQTYDRQQKFRHYRTIPTFQEYVLIDQTERAIEQFCKTADKRWSFYEYDDQDSALIFNSFELQVPLADVYEQVEFDAKEPEDEA